MKRNIVFGSMVLALGLCAQSFGFDLLDRMLGANGCGCEVSCCTSVGPSCGAPACAAPTCAAPAPTCGAEPTCAGYDAGCCRNKCCGLNLRGLLGARRCCKPACGCGAPACAAPACAAPAIPTCGAEVTCAAVPACHSRCRKPCLLDRLFCCKSRCCKPDHVGCGAPTCGAEPACGIMGNGKHFPPPPPVPVDTK